MPDFKDGDLTVQIHPPANGWMRLAWFGKSNTREPVKVLAPLFTDVAKQAQEAKVGLELRFEKLEFFNSSTITALIHFVQTCRSKSIPLAIVYDSAQKWQRLSFDALRILEKNDGLVKFRAADAQ